MVTSVDRCQIAIKRGEDVVEALVLIAKSEAAFDADDVSAEDGELVKKVTVPRDKGGVKAPRGRGFSAMAIVPMAYEPTFSLDLSGLFCLSAVLS
jgi:hypothetical protein